MRYSEINQGQCIVSPVWTISYLFKALIWLNLLLHPLFSERKNRWLHWFNVNQILFSHIVKIKLGLDLQCVFFSWVLKALLCLNLFIHNLHSNGTSPVWILSCVFKLPLSCTKYCNGNKVFIKSSNTKRIIESLGSFSSLGAWPLGMKIWTLWIGNFNAMYFSHNVKDEISPVIDPDSSSIRNPT